MTHNDQKISQKLKTIKSDLRACLASSKSGLTTIELTQDYKYLTTEDSFPFQEFNFKTAEEFLTSHHFQDVMEFKINKWHVKVNEKIKHIRDFVEGQRSNGKCRRSGLGPNGDGESLPVSSKVDIGVRPHSNVNENIVPPSASTFIQKPQPINKKSTKNPNKNEFSEFDDIFKNYKEKLDKEKAKEKTQVKELEKSQCKAVITSPPTSLLGTNSLASTCAGQTFEQRQAKIVKRLKMFKSCIEKLVKDHYYKEKTNPLQIDQLHQTMTKTFPKLEYRKVQCQNLKQVLDKADCDLLLSKENFIFLPDDNQICDIITPNKVEKTGFIIKPDTFKHEELEISNDQIWTNAYITYIYNPNMIYVQKMNQQSSKRFKSLQERMQKCGENSEFINLPKRWLLDNNLCYCIYYDKVNDEYYRAWTLSKLDSRSSSNIDVYLLDYGQELSNVNISDLYCLPKKFSLLKAQAIPISLKNVYNKITKTDLPIGHLSSGSEPFSEPHQLWTNHNAKKITQELNFWKTHQTQKNYGIKIKILKGYDAINAPVTDENYENICFEKFILENNLEAHFVCDVFICDGEYRVVLD